MLLRMDENSRQEAKMAILQTQSAKHTPQAGYHSQAGRPSVLSHHDSLHLQSHRDSPQPPATRAILHPPQARTAFGPPIYLLGQRDSPLVSSQLITGHLNDTTTADSFRTIDSQSWEDEDY